MAEQPKYGKGSKSRISNIKRFGENFDEINWKSNKESSERETITAAFCINCGKEIFKGLACHECMVKDIL